MAEIFEICPFWIVTSTVVVPPLYPVPVPWYVPSLYRPCAEDCVAAVSDAAALGAVSEDAAAVVPDAVVPEAEADTGGVVPAADVSDIPFSDMEEACDVSACEAAARSVIYRTDE